MDSLRLLDEFYEKADVEGKRYLVGMLYPEKLIFDGVMYRTPSMDLAAKLIQQKNFGQKKSSLFRLLLKLGSLMVLINSQFIADLKRLADLKRKMDEFDELGKGLKVVNSRPQK